MFRRCADVGVDSCVGFGQARIEGGSDRVAEDHGAGHEGDAEEDREGGREQPQLACCELFDGEYEHLDQAPK